MNVVFISPHFPPQFERFCVALKQRGVNVLGVGDAPWHELSDTLKGALAEYYQANLEDLSQAQRALGYLTWKHGRLDRIDSHNEHWLGLEAQLREDFNIPGPRPRQMQEQRTKSGMARLFAQARVPHPAGIQVTSKEAVRAFALEHGYPLVFKPDLGVGAARTFKVSTVEELDRVLDEDLTGYLVQPFVAGDIVSYDGLVDREGRVVFETSHAYSAGVMDIVNGRLDMAYWNLRQIPEALVTLGRRVLATFGIRERFFHLEFFQLPNGSYRALELNIRPPGGFTTDMMNYSADVDVYRLWAQVLCGEDLGGFTYQRRYHVAHVSRRHHRTYRHPTGALPGLLGDALLWVRPMPQALAGAMGDEMVLLRHPDLERLQALVAEVQAPG